MGPPIRRSKNGKLQFPFLALGRETTFSTARAKPIRFIFSGSPRSNENSNKLYSFPEINLLKSMKISQLGRLMTLQTGKKVL